MNRRGIISLTCLLSAFLYMAGGGDGYSMLSAVCKQQEKCENSGFLVLDLLVDEFRQHSPMIRRLEGTDCGCFTFWLFMIKN